jgi:hypothetical protein
LPKLPAYSTGHDHQEVQGVWSIPVTATGRLKVRVEVQQTLAYGALIGWTKKFRVYKDDQQKVVFLEDIGLDDLTEKVDSKDLTLPID